MDGNPTGVPLLTLSSEPARLLHPSEEAFLALTHTHTHTHTHIHTCTHTNLHTHSLTHSKPFIVLVPTDKQTKTTKNANNNNNIGFFLTCVQCVTEAIRHS